jgi:hypothetical protein
MKINFVTGKLADISTSHITKEDNEILTSLASQSDSPIRIMNDQYGYIVSVGSPEDVEGYNLGLSNNFWRIMRLMSESGIQKVLFDCDGEMYPDLQIFEW